MQEDGEFTRASIAAALTAWIGFLIGPNAMLSATQGLFMPSLSEHFALSRTEVSAILLIGPWTVAVALPFAGRAMDRFGLRAVIVPGILLFGLTHLLFSAVNTTWQLIGVTFLLGIGAAMHSSVGYAKLVSQWFARKRGLILGLVSALGAGLGSTLMPQFDLPLLENYGWRGGYFGNGLLVLVIGFPVILFCLRERVAKTGSGGHSAEATFGVTWREGLRTPTFWLIFFAVLLTCVALLGTIMHGFPMLTERGFSNRIGATAISCMFFGSVSGQFLSGAIVDRFNSPRVAVPFFLGGLVGFFVVHSVTQNVAVLLGGSVLLGVGLGGENALAAYMTSRYFGFKAFGNLYGFLFAAANIGVGAGLMGMGAIHDLTGTYDLARPILGGSMAAATLCILLLRPFIYASVRPGDEAAAA